VEVSCRRWQYVRVHKVGSYVILQTSEPPHQREKIASGLLATKGAHGIHA
jgi:hypothetical protein